MIQCEVLSTGLSYLGDSWLFIGKFILQCFGGVARHHALQVHIIVKDAQTVKQRSFTWVIGFRVQHFEQCAHRQTSRTAPGESFDNEDNGR